MSTSSQLSSSSQLSYDSDSDYSTASDLSDVDISEAHVKAKVLSKLSDIIRRLQESNGFFVGQRAHFEDVCSSFMAPLTNDALQASVDAQAALRALKMKKELLGVVEALDLIRQHISYQARVLQEQSKACTLHRGLVSLPDDVLSIILALASDRNQSMVKSVQAATRLSHVCERFQGLIISRSNFWNGWSSDMGEEMISTCLVRYRGHNANLNMVISLGALRQTTSDYLRLVCQRPECWKGFSLEVLSSDNPDLSDGELVALAKATEGIVLPSLARLDIRSNSFAMLREQQDRSSFCAATHFYSSWTTPRLKYLSTKNLIPVPFSGSRSVTSITIDIGFDDDTFPPRSDVFTGRLDIGAIVSLLSSCSVLEYLSLRIGITGEAVLPTSRARPLEMASLGQMDLRFKTSNIAPIRLFLQNVHFPNVSTLSLCIITPPYPFHDEHEIEDGTRRALKAVFPNTEVFPNMTRLVLKMFHLKPPWTRLSYDGPYNVYNLCAHIPSLHVPQLQHLEYNAAEVKFVPEDQEIPALKSLVLRGGREQRNRFFRILWRLQKQGDLSSCRLIDARGRVRRLARSKDFKHEMWDEDESPFEPDN